MLNKVFISSALSLCLGLSGCDDNETEQEQLSQQLKSTLESASGGEGLSAFILPEEHDLDAIPQDPNNPLSPAKVALGQRLYHETALATGGVNSSLVGTWSCASCHHAAAGFKSGILQGIGEGGLGFGITGEDRRLNEGFDKDATDPSLVPDVQPVTSPAVLNAAYQEVMLWNGQFGNQENGAVNIGLSDEVLATPGTPKAENSRGFSGIETQAIAGLGVHRLIADESSILASNPSYQALFDAAFTGSTDMHESAALAIAAFERTIIANQSPFQLWLKGDESAMSEEELRGALLFFGDAGCSDCHSGPALSSPLNGTEDQLFMALGFADFDPNNRAVTGSVDLASAKGRGGFTGESADDYKFKVPQLYNLTDTEVFGHGGSFSAVRDVVAYLNAAVPQKILPEGRLDTRFVPLGLNDDEMDDITAFIEVSLYDPNLQRYAPESLPSGNCFPVNDSAARADLGC